MNGPLEHAQTQALKQLSGVGLRAIARQLKMPPSSVHKALSMAAQRRY
jgi:DNA-binding IclR family transcriptional regulator